MIEQQYWFVGATLNDVDETETFVERGIWRHDFEKPRDDVKSMKPGDRIAIKSAYVRKKDLPFDNRGIPVSVMAIKAIGTVRDNPGDGFRVEVDWQPLEPLREWYFFTARPTVWRPKPDHRMARRLIAFAFNNEAQDYQHFLADPYWGTKYRPENFDVATDSPKTTTEFAWTSFYASIVAALAKHAGDRSGLIRFIADFPGKDGGANYLASDRYRDGGRGPVRDIDPFTFLGMFNRQSTDARRTRIAQEIATFLGVTDPPPKSFASIPLLNAQKSWLFPYEVDRDADHIPTLWRLFDAAIAWADAEQDETQDAAEQRRLRGVFRNALDAAHVLPGAAWNLTMGLYWIRPNAFVPLDTLSRTYIREQLGVNAQIVKSTGKLDGVAYLDLIDELQDGFSHGEWPVGSFMQLSFAAWAPAPAAPTDAAGPEPADTPDSAPAPTYDVDSIAADGCFLEPATLRLIKRRLEDKKNIVLQGPPGTGKTWLARRLGYAVLGVVDPRRVHVLQFHPGMTYEDFIRGFRPGNTGKLELLDGAFLNIVNACQSSKQPHVVVLEEINRGNPAQIFGELLTLLEASHRTEQSALHLAYRKVGEPPLWLPQNLYVIGTMNLADRSLAMVDMALRRRFAFFDMEPKVDQRWQTFVIEKRNVPAELAAQIGDRVISVNADIAKYDHGAHLRIGHSFVTPMAVLEAGTADQWFKDVVAHDILPYLREAFFDDPDKVDAWQKTLLGSNA